ncbi:glycosyltransferase family 4 protein [Chitinimonas lacunae]|uniref:Glycosyltransferase family 4 protein n=1 Tax=Chitinimonas lacunae TaxID=1963018 RepID=A0ABV8MM20_9NEIS
MRIAYVTETYPPEFNGVSLNAARSVGYLRKRGHVVELIRPMRQDEIERDSPEEWLTPSLALPLSQDQRLGLPILWRLQKRWEKRRPQVVHVATEGPLAWAAVRAAQTLSIPVTSDFCANANEYSSHYGRGWAGPVVMAYLRHFHNAADLTFVPTQTLRHRLFTEGFQALEVLGRGVDTRLFSPDHYQVSLREQWGAAPGEPVMLYSGQLNAEENAELACQTFQAVHAYMPELRMVVVGDGPLLETLRQRHPEVHFVGNQRGSTLAEHYASADILLYPSLSDGCSNVLLEAMASGMAVLAFDCGAAAEYIDDCVNGMLVTPGDVQGFVDDAYQMANELSRFLSLRLQARTSAQRHQWDTVLSRFEGALRQLGSETEQREVAYLPT